MNEEKLKIELQKKIDHYNAISEAELKTGHVNMSWFYAGKADAFTDFYNEMFPEMEKERAYPLNVQEYEELMESVIRQYK